MTPSSVPHVIWTLRAIANRLGVSKEETVISYAMRPRDPLRIQHQFGRYWIKTETLDAWKERERANNACQRLVGRREICQCLRMSWNTAKAYARRADDPLPINGLGGPAPWIYHGAWVDWFHAQNESARRVWLTSLLKEQQSISRDSNVDSGRPDTAGVAIVRVDSRETRR